MSRGDLPLDLRGPIAAFRKRLPRTAHGESHILNNSAYYPDRFDLQVVIFDLIGQENRYLYPMKLLCGLRQRRRRLQPAAVLQEN
jgi:hypothetical protein